MAESGPEGQHWVNDRFFYRCAWRSVSCCDLGRAMGALPEHKKPAAGVVPAVGKGWYRLEGLGVQAAGGASEPTHSCHSGEPAVGSKASILARSCLSGTRRIPRPMTQTDARQQTKRPAVSRHTQMRDRSRRIAYLGRISGG
jgi:hypothetical protein